MSQASRALAPVFNLDALANLMTAHGLGVTKALQLEPLTGGQSNPAYRVHGANLPLVLRKKPPGALLPSAHAVDREFRIMKALRNTEVAVPEVYVYSDDVTITGTPFYLMAYLDGRVFVDQSLPGISRTERAAIYNEMNRVIAALHRIDPATVGLSDYGRAGNYFARQIARWTRQYQDSRLEDIKAMDALIAWLPERIPADEQSTIVHGDYRLDNLVFDHVEPRIIGVLDWELSTLGHPLADFSYHCMSWRIPADLWRGIGGLNLNDLGIPEETDYIRRYGEATGALALEHWDFYMAYNLFRIAAILQGVAKRASDGNAAAANATDMGRKARPLAELGWTIAQGYDASKK